MKKTIIMILSISLLAACAKKAEEPEADKEDQTAGVMIVNVAADKANCINLTPKECLKIDGSLFYDDSQNETFEYGYEYKLKIQRQYVKKDKKPKPKKQLYTYHLIEVLDKTKIN